MEVLVHEILNFVDKDLAINTMCNQKMHFNEHFVNQLNNN